MDKITLLCAYSTTYKTTNSREYKTTVRTNKLKSMLKNHNRSWAMVILIPSVLCIFYILSEFESFKLIILKYFIVMEKIIRVTDMCVKI